ncbi:MAG: hypothetical protein AAF547_09200 [Actinomycetota bacterium]
MIELDGASVLLQWATGGLLFLWVTTRHRLVGLGYGWLLRGTYGLMALGALAAGLVFDPLLLRDLSAAGVALAAAVTLVVSVVRKDAGVTNQKALAEARTARVAAMTGIDRTARDKGDGPEFDPRLDLIAPAIGLVGVVAAAVDAGGPTWLAVARMVTGTVFLGAVSDAMLLGHWYLVQPGLSREPIGELVRWTGISWVPEVVLLLIPTGMVSVWTGAIDDGWNGMLGWFWAACAVTTIGLVGVTVAALREKQYSAVMAATGLLYLAILTAFGTDLVARALLANPVA